MRLSPLASGTALLALATSLAAAAPARAAYTVTLAQEGSNVVATGSGTINTAGLSFIFGVNSGSSLWPLYGQILIGPVTSEDTGLYSGVSGPTSFGTGGISISANSGNGDLVGILGIEGLLSVPAGYVSGSALMDTSTYDNQTFASLGVTPGSYVWTWGSGATADSFTLDIAAVSTVPEPASLTLFGTGLLGLGLVRRRRGGARD